MNFSILKGFDFISVTIPKRASLVCDQRIAFPEKTHNIHTRANTTSPKEKEIRRCWIDTEEVIKICGRCYRSALRSKNKKKLIDLSSKAVTFSVVVA